MSASFKAILAATTKAAPLPKTKQRAILSALALSPHDTIEAIHELCWRRFRQEQPVDQLAWTFVSAAIGPREKLPWQKVDVIRIVRMVTPRPDTLPPAFVVRVVDQYLTAGGSLNKQERTWIVQLATSFEKFSNDAAMRRAVARLRVLASPPAPERGR